MPKRNEVSNPVPAETATTASEATSGKNKPAHEVRLGRVKAVIWANASEAGTRYNVTVRRIFKRDGSANWEQSDSFGRDDLPQLIEVVHQAWVWIYGQAS
jgi:aryl-phospho-beta-D-glucosidase BglC (GH1 family)